MNNEWLRSVVIFRDIKIAFYAQSVLFRNENYSFINLIIWLKFTFSSLNETTRAVYPTVLLCFYYYFPSLRQRRSLLPPPGFEFQFKRNFLMIKVRTMILIHLIECFKKIKSINLHNVEPISNFHHVGVTQHPALSKGSEKGQKLRRITWATDFFSARKRRKKVLSLPQFTRQSFA